MRQANFARMNQIVIAIFTAIVFLSIFNSFASDQSDSYNDTVKITINYPSTGDTIPIKVMKNAAFTITLSSNPSTGYSWTLDENLDTNILKSNGSRYITHHNQDNPKLVGQGGVEVWTFTATGSGTQIVNLKYHRPWEKNVQPVRIQILNVTVQ